MIHKNKKWGYIDSTGKEIVPPKYLEVHYFSENLALVVIDTIPSQSNVFDENDSLLEHYPCIDKIYGYIDNTGEFRIKPKLKYRQKKIYHNKSWTIDTTNNKFAEFYFSNGLALYQDTSTFMFGFIDIKGDIQIQANYTKLAPFSEGLAVFSKDDFVGNYGCIDINENIIIEPKYLIIKDFKQGLSFATLSSNAEILNKGIITLGRPETFIINKKEKSKQNL